MAAFFDLKSINKPAKFLGLLLILLFPFFFLGGPTPYSTPLFSAWWNLGHFIFFACITVFLINVTPYFREYSFFKISAFIIVLGGIIEIIQAQIGRDGNWLDVGRDLAGAWLGYFWFSPQNKINAYTKYLCILFFIPDMFYIASAAGAQIYTIRQFPLLADMESSIELHGYKGNIKRTDKIQVHGQHSLQVHLNLDTYSGVSFNEFFQSWQGYSQLEFDIYNPQSNILLIIIRVSDVEHLMGSNDYNDRFNQRLQLAYGWNHFKIPLAHIEMAPKTRKMDLSHIESVAIFSMHLQHEQDIYIDNIRLTK